MVPSQTGKHTCSSHDLRDGEKQPSLNLAYFRDADMKALLYYMKLNFS